MLSVQPLGTLAKQRLLALNPGFVIADNFYICLQCQIELKNRFEQRFKPEVKVTVLSKVLSFKRKPTSTTTASSSSTDIVNNPNVSLIFILRRLKLIHVVFKLC